MSLFILLAGLGLLMVLMVRFKFNPFLALTIVAILLGFCFGMPADKILSSIQNGIASTLGSILLLLTLGAMFGKLLSESGAADKIGEGLTGKFGTRYIQWAMLLTAFVVGLPMFYTAGFVLLLPIVFSVAARTKLPLLYMAIPMAASLSVTHGFLPPHPGPSAIAVIYKADLGLTLMYGLIIAIPTVMVAGPWWGGMVSRLKIMESIPPPESVQADTRQSSPGFFNSLFTALFPILLIMFAAVLRLAVPQGNANRYFDLFFFLGDPAIALLAGLMVALFTLNANLPSDPGKKSDLFTQGIHSVAGILLIIAAGGAFKQILVDSGVGNYIASLFGQLDLSPLFVAWVLAAIIRVALGSATVAALASAGMALPFMTAGTSPELMVLATGSGSLMFSHVNDAGFWIFKEYFHLSIPQTLLSWSVMETIVSCMGLIGVLVLDVFI
jgi:gluconate transporter